MPRPDIGEGKKLRIMVLTRGFPPLTGGIERTILNVYLRLCVTHEIVVVTPNEPGAKAYDKTVPFRVVRTPKVPVLRNRFQSPLIGMLIWALWTALWSRPDQIHCDQVDTAIVGKLLGWLFRTPYLIFAHGMEVTDGNRMFVKRNVFGSAAAILPPSEYTHRKLVEVMGVRPCLSHVTHPGVDMTRFRSVADLKSKVIEKHNLHNRKTLLTVGRMPGQGRSKGQDTVIRSMPMLRERIANLTYLIVGDGPERKELERLADSSGVREHVIFAGRVPDEELLGYYAACDVFLMMSREGASRHGGFVFEGFGIVFLEANALGKPVVGSRSGGIPDAIVDGETGFLVDPEDQSSLVETLVRLTEDPALAKRLGEQGQQRVKEFFTYDRMAEQVREICTRLSGRPVAQS